MTNAGLPVKSLEVGMRMLNKKISENDPALQKLGISTKDGSTALMQLSDVFKNSADGANKTALAIRLFGRSGTAMIPFLNQGSAAIGAQEKSLIRLGLILNDVTVNKLADMDDKFDELENTMKGAQNIFGGIMASLVTPVFDGLRDMIGAVRGAFNALASDPAMASALQTMGELWAAVLRVGGGAIVTLINFIATLIKYLEPVFKMLTYIFNGMAGLMGIKVQEAVVVPKRKPGDEGLPEGLSANKKVGAEKITAWEALVKSITESLGKIEAKSPVMDKLAFRIGNNLAEGFGLGSAAVKVLTGDIDGLMKVIASKAPAAAADAMKRLASATGEAHSAAKAVVGGGAVGGKGPAGPSGVEVKVDAKLSTGSLTELTSKIKASGYGAGKDWSTAFMETVKSDRDAISKVLDFINPISWTTKAAGLTPEGHANQAKYAEETRLLDKKYMVEGLWAELTGKKRLDFEKQITNLSAAGQNSLFDKTMSDIGAEGRARVAEWQKYRRAKSSDADLPEGMPRLKVGTTPVAPKAAAPTSAPKPSPFGAASPTQMYGLKPPIIVPGPLMGGGAGPAAITATTNEIKKLTSATDTATTALDKTGASGAAAGVKTRSGFLDASRVVGELASYALGAAQTVGESMGMVGSELSMFVDSYAKSFADSVVKMQVEIFNTTINLASQLKISEKAARSFAKSLQEIKMDKASVEEALQGIATMLGISPSIELVIQLVKKGVFTQEQADAMYPEFKKGVSLELMVYPKWAKEQPGGGGGIPKEERLGDTRGKFGSMEPKGFAGFKAPSGLASLPGVFGNISESMAKMGARAEVILKLFAEFLKSLGMTKDEAMSADDGLTQFGNSTQIAQGKFDNMVKLGFDPFYARIKAGFPDIEMPITPEMVDEYIVTMRLATKASLDNTNATSYEKMVMEELRASVRGTMEEYQKLSKAATWREQNAANVDIEGKNKMWSPEAIEGQRRANEYAAGKDKETTQTPADKMKETRLEIGLLIDDMKLAMEQVTSLTDVVANGITMVTDGLSAGLTFVFDKIGSRSLTMKNTLDAVWKSIRSAFVNMLAAMITKVIAYFVIVMALNAIGAVFGHPSLGADLARLASMGTEKGGDKWTPSSKKAFASGGVVQGPGTSTSDSITAKLSRGEYVVRAAAVGLPGVRAALDRINSMSPGAAIKLNGMADGGLVSPAPARGFSAVFPQSPISHEYSSTSSLVRAISSTLAKVITSTTANNQSANSQRNTNIKNDVVIQTFSPRDVMMQYTSPRGVLRDASSKLALTGEY